jgi:energy-coupling factor transporter ATP-binding protein EcfA2
MPSPDDNQLTYLARTNFRNTQKLVGLKPADRNAHIYVLGKTGTGKSTLLETLARQDLAHGGGFALLDPHGDLVERVLAAVPPGRRETLIYMNVSDTARPLGFNPLEAVPPEKRALAASGLLDVFKKLWADSWGPRLEHILRNALLVLLDQPSATLADILRLLDDRDFRRHVAERTPNAQVRRFWLSEFEHYPLRFRAEAIAPAQNKVGAFLANPVLQRILTQPKSAFDLRQVMDEGRVLLVNLAKGKLGEDTAALLGSLLVARIGLAALSRADVPESERRDFFVYLDEFQNFSTLSLATMLPELRKYHVGLVLAHQHLAQLDPAVREAILGNVGTTLAFRLGATDAQLLEPAFAPEVRAEDLVGLPNYSVYLKLIAGGITSRPFSAETFSASTRPDATEPGETSRTYGY